MTIGAWNQHPDFLILHPRRGLLVIEVKDWKLENVRSMDGLTATLQADGREVRKSNPLEQAKQYAFGVCRLLESDPALVGEAGTSFQGKLVFPWGYGVVLANISRKAFAGTDLGNVIPPERVICQDELVESVDAEAFQQRLWGDVRGAAYRPGDGSPAGAARKEHGGGPSGDPRGGRVLRVVYNPSHKPPRVITMHFDRRQEGKP